MYFQGIPDRKTERSRHVRNHGHRLAADVVSDADHCFGEVHGVFIRFHKRARARFDVKHDGICSGGDFLLIIELAISGMEFTVPVTSRARIQLFIGRRQIAALSDDGYLVAVHKLDEFIFDNSTWKPSIASSLSMVPPYGQDRGRTF